MLKNLTIEQVNNLKDSLIAVGGSSATGGAIAASNPSVNPLISTVLVPLIAGIIAPFFKKLGDVLIERIKISNENRKIKKQKHEN